MPSKVQKWKQGLYRSVFRGWSGRPFGHQSACGVTALGPPRHLNLGFAPVSASWQLRHRSEKIRHLNQPPGVARRTAEPKRVDNKPAYKKRGSARRRPSRKNAENHFEIASSIFSSHIFETTGSVKTIHGPHLSDHTPPNEAACDVDVVKHAF